jgi:hypothetical protein
MEEFRNYISILSGDMPGKGHQTTTAGEETKSSKIPVKFKADIETLQELYPGDTEITMTLREALEKIPRDRKRVDAYETLAKWMKENMGIELIVKSQKTKKDG